jgi:hypothetical protein
MILKPVIDRCHLCGQETELTFEHVPPRRAFNNTGVLIKEMDLKLPPKEGANPSKLFMYQKGMGSYTLCGKCNNDTGAFYGAPFVDFCRKGMRILQASNYRPMLFYMMEIYPLAIIKQIVSMFLSINSMGFRDKNIDLALFVLNRERKYLPKKYRFFIYFNLEGMHRATPHTTKIDFNKYTFEHKRTTVMTEISFPPFGYLLLIDSEKPASDIVEITFFTQYGIWERKTISMRYPVNPTHTIFPGDYRSVERIRKDIQEKGGIVPEG